MITTMIIMNMQNKVYTIHFFSPPNDQLMAVPEQQLQNPKILNFLKKFKLMDKRGFDRTKIRAESLLPPSQPSFLN